MSAIRKAAIVCCSNGQNRKYSEKITEFLMKFYKDDSVDVVFDISGGDLANEILHLLDKILLLESYSGNVARMAAYLSQLKQLGAFEKVQGILLGTFTEMESQGYLPTVWEMLRAYIDENLPVAVTKEIGHGTDSKAIVIGEKLTLKK